MSTFDKVKESAIDAGLTESDAKAYATEFIQVLGIQEATDRINCGCGCENA